MYKYIFIVILFFAQSGFAQIQSEEDFLPKSGSVFSMEKNKAEEASYVSYKHAIKWNIFMATRGLVGLHYEYIASDIFSAQIGTGLDLFNDVIASVGVTDGLYNLSSQSSNVDLWDLMYGDEKNVRTSNFNFFINPGVTLNYESLWSFNEAFIRLDFRYRSFKQLYNYSYNNGFNDLQDDIEVRISQKSINLINGLKFDSGNSIKVIHELYYGLGMNIFSYNDLISAQNGGTFSDGPLVLSDNKINNIGLSFLLGYTVGIGWK